MSETSIIDLSQFDGEVPEMEPCPDGTETKVRVTGAITGNNKNNEPYIMLFLEAPEFPSSPDFAQYLPMPTTEMGAKKQGQCTRAIREVGDALDFNFFEASIDVTDAIGYDSNAILGVGTDKEDKPCNTVKQWVGEFTGSSSIDGPF